jgi:trimeric autotransporter adhesin
VGPPNIEALLGAFCFLVNETYLYGIRYAKFVVPLVKAVQDLNKQDEDQQKLILELTKRIKKLESK